MGQRKKLLAVDEAYVAMYIFLPTPVFKINLKRERLSVPSSQQASELKGERLSRTRKKFLAVGEACVAIF